MNDPQSQPHPLRRPADPRTAWSLDPAPAPVQPVQLPPRPAAVHDTLQIDACASSWAELATALADAEVPLEVGDTAVLRALAKLDRTTVTVLARWLRTAGRAGGGPW